MLWVWVSGSGWGLGSLPWAAYFGVLAGFGWVLR